MVTATLSEASDEDITVTLTASGGTADTDDHGLTMQELTIEAGDLTATFTISTTDDAIYEPRRDTCIEIEFLGGS